MSIEEVLTEIRLWIRRHPEPYTYWADAIRAEIEEKARLAAGLREKNAEIYEHCYAHVEMMREQDAKIERLREAVQKLLACPAIADEDFSDPEWGCEITREAEAFARAAIAGKEPQP